MITCSSPSLSPPYHFPPSPIKNIVFFVSHLFSSPRQVSTALTSAGTTSSSTQQHSSHHSSSSQQTGTGYQYNNYSSPNYGYSNSYGSSNYGYRRYHYGRGRYHYGRSETGLIATFSHIIVSSCFLQDLLVL